MAIRQFSQVELPDFFVSPREYFFEMVQQGIARKQFNPPEPARHYLVNLLEHYLDARNLFDDHVGENGQKRPSTLAETYLRAMDPTLPDRTEVLRRLGDKALYVSGFFGDSLNRSLVDIDYYAGVGGAAYGNLAEIVVEGEVSNVYRVFSSHFLDFVDVLTYISQKSFIQSDEGILRLYDRYLKTGSEMARQRLVEMGVIPLDRSQLRKTSQD